MMGGYWGATTPHMFGGSALLGGWSVIAMGFGFLLVIGLIVWLVASQRGVTPSAAGQAVLHSASPAPHASDGAEAIVRERFARGEIDLEEFNRAISALRGAR